MIYIIGDSHVSVFSGLDYTDDGLRHIQPEFGSCYTLVQGNLKPVINKFEQRIPYFCPIKIGSHTAYNSYKKIDKINQVIEEYNITGNDYIFFSFGEIDIRNHIGFHVGSEYSTLDEGINNCVDEYFKTIIYYKNKNLKVGVYAPPASSIGNNSPKDFGDVILRNKMTIQFNRYLKSKCTENRILFKDISHEMVLENGTTDQKFILDDIHLSQHAMPLLINKFSDIING